MSKSKTVLLVLRVVVVFSFLCTISSCYKDEDQLNDASSSKLPSKERFAEIFSAAISNNEDLRSFIKDEALRQFDKDYDVFYPFVKDRTICGGKTFRDYLLDYVDEKELSKIEKDNPF